jgi:SAM-dependent methyltransferase
MARAFPQSRFFGFDTHAPSIEAARRNAREQGLEDRVHFELARATDYRNENYGLVCFFDTLHDMGDPVAAARHAADTLAPGGTVLLVEPFAHDRVEDNLTMSGHLYYGASTVICCAHAISEGGRLVLGAQAGPRRLAEVFRKAGLTHFRKAAETPFNLICEVRR